MTEPHPTVFVVDDDAAVRRSLARLLKSAGYHTESFASADEFIECRKRNPLPGCALVDIQMPGMNGLEVQARLAGAKMDVPLIFMTAHDEAGVEEQALRGGAVGFLRKPFSDEALVELIRIGLQGTKITRLEK